jgi:hypothetical protein
MNNFKSSAYSNETKYVNICKLHNVIKSTRNTPDIDWCKLIHNKYNKTDSHNAIPTIDTVSITPTINPVSITPILNTFESKSEIYNDNYTQLDIDLFWKKIKKIKCIDKDEGRMTYRNVKLNTFSKDHIIKLLDIKFLKELENAIKDIPIPFTKGQPEYNNFLTHIIAKGKPFYEGIKMNPVVCLYLCDNYYPIYTWLKK